MSKPRWRGLDRRTQNREENPPCPTCSAPPDLTTVTARTPAFIYFKCIRCGNVWTVDTQDDRPKRSRS